MLGDRAGLTINSIDEDSIEACTATVRQADIFDAARVAFAGQTGSCQHGGDGRDDDAVDVHLVVDLGFLIG